MGSWNLDTVVFIMALGTNSETISWFKKQYHLGNVNSETRLGLSIILRQTQKLRYTFIQHQSVNHALLGFLKTFKNQKAWTAILMDITAIEEEGNTWDFEFLSKSVK